MKNAKRFPPVPVRLYYKDDDEIRLVKEAALHRGIGFNLFMRLAVLEAAKRALATPPATFLGQDPELLKSEI